MLADIDSLNPRPHQRNISAYTDPTPHCHFVKVTTKTTWIQFEFCEDIARNHYFVYLNTQSLSNMSRLLEGKAAAITGGVTGTVHPTTFD